MREDREYLGMAAIEGSRSALLQICKRLQWKEYDVVTEDYQERLEYHMFNGGIYAPRAIAFELAEEFGTAVQFSYEPGYEIYCEYEKPELRPEQVAPIQDVLQAFEDHHDVVLQAYTGSGKTVMGCYIAKELGASTLIIVDQNKLKQQWVDTLVNLFGYEAEEIGIVQGHIDTWEYKHDFTIAMVQTIFNKDLPIEFVESFGCCIIDEFHAVGAEQYSNVFEAIPATYRLSLSATDRHDSRKKVIKWHIEGTRVILAEQRKPSQVRYVVYDGPMQSFYAQKSSKDGRYISEIVDDGERNVFIAECLKALYEAGRTILVIGHRINHLESLHALCAMEGIPETEMIMYTGSENVWGYIKDKEPASMPEGYDPSVPFTPVKFEVKNKKVKLDGKNDLLHTSRIIFSTYAIFSKGVDVPEIDTGFDVTPKTTFVQIHGRILRLVAGKLIPIWVTIRDVNSFRAERQFAARIKEFMISNAEVYRWRPDRGLKRHEGVRLCREAIERSAKLKGARIVTGVGGKNVLQAQSTVIT